MSKIRLLFFIFAILFLLGCTPKPKWEGMDQVEYVKFPELGVLEVGVQAIEGQLPKLIIRNAAKKVFFQMEMGHAYDPHPENFEYDGSIEFKVIHISGLPNPLLNVVASGGGGSDNLWEMTLIGVVSGKIKRLWKQTEPLPNAGGFFVGDLGNDRGVGIALWHYIGGHECHICPHKYALFLYRWNKEKSQFDIGPHFITKDTYGDGNDALESLGFGFKDQRF
jgi:hypothetical protein